jgi:hypothetical protein
MARVLAVASVSAGGYAFCARPVAHASATWRRPICRRRREMSITRHYTAPPARRVRVTVRKRCARVVPSRPCDDTLQPAEPHVIALRRHAAACRVVLRPHAMTRCSLQSGTSSRCDATLQPAESYCAHMRRHAAARRVARHRVAMPRCNLQSRTAPTCDATLQPAESHVIALPGHAAARGVAPQPVVSPPAGAGGALPGPHRRPGSGQRQASMSIHVTI